MAQIEWGPELELGVAAIDEQHHHIVRMLNELDRAFEKNSPADEVARILVELKAHTQMHFDYEEKLLRRYDYPTTDLHAATHAAYLEKIQGLLTNLPGPVRRREVQALLGDWMVHHIQEADRGYLPALAGPVRKP